ncbi:hypothetical protein LG413_12290 [Acetobacter persici]|nr:hypothetical protein [Acetobacter persici]
MQVQGVEDHTLHRIRAVRSFGNVQAGDLGGWVETDGNHKEGRTTRLPNLSHDGDCWLYGDAKAFAGANVNGDAKMKGLAQAFGEAVVGGSSIVADHAVIDGLHKRRPISEGRGDAVVALNAEVLGYSQVRGERVSGEAKINTEKKYHFTGEKLDVDGRVLNRIRASQPFFKGNGELVIAGELGGWIEDERNLSHTGGAWVADDAKVYGLAVVADDALAQGRSTVRDQAYLSGKAVMDGQSCLERFSSANGNVRMSGNARATDNATLNDNAQLAGDALVAGYGTVAGHAQMDDNTKVKDSAYLGGHARLSDDAEVSNAASVTGRWHLEGNDIAWRNDNMSMRAQLDENTYVMNGEEIPLEEALEAGLGKDGEDYTVGRNKNSDYELYRLNGSRKVPTGITSDMEDVDDALLDLFNKARTNPDIMESGKIILTTDEYESRQTNDAENDIRPSM